jgi:uncharacterized protein YndB with AHSA1/START domain
VIDVLHQINTVERRVGSRVLEAGEARTVTVARTYDATVEEVWNACTNRERIPRWFLPISGDLRVGGRYQLAGNASGTIERCDPPRTFAATWEFGGEVTWIELRLSALAGGGTRFELEHLAHVDDERWAEFGPGAVGLGWDLTLLGLARHLATGESADPAEVAAWMGSEEGRRFMELSSRGWRDASIAAGTDPAEGTAAADRTTAAYTAAPSEAASDH